MTRRLVVSAWLGFALAALLFYPLAVALDADIYYLQWQSSHAVETMAAVAGLALVLACFVFVFWSRSDRLSTAALVVIAAIPLASLAAGLSRQLPFDDVMRGAWENRAIRLALPTAFVGLLTGWFVAWPLAFRRWLRRLLILVSPISLVVAGSLVQSTRVPDTTVRFERTPAATGSLQSACAPVLALLFDELSFSYLYDDEGGVRPEFPEISRVASTATNYLSVSAPGGETLTSVPSFLAARRIQGIRVEDDGLAEVAADGGGVPFSATEPDGLFATAHRLGLSPEMGGYYLSYCELLATMADACHSLSFYNASSAHEGFSAVDPLLTTLTLWPRQFPFGLLKNPPFAILQRRLVEKTAAFARRPMSASRPVFRFVHFSVPHLPFVFDANGYNPPFDPLRTEPDTEYVRQLQYVDKLVGDLMAHMRSTGAYDGTTVVILADHGFRFGGRERDPRHIPFIAKGAGQHEKVDVTVPRQGEQLLKQVVEDSCINRYTVS